MNSYAVLPAITHESQFTFVCSAISPQHIYVSSEQSTSHQTHW